MKIRTKVPVTHIDSENIVTGGTRQGVVRMLIGDVNAVVLANGNAAIQVKYAYLDDQDVELPTKDRGQKVIQEGVVEMSEGLGNSGSSFVAHLMADVKSFAMSEMSSRFGIELSDIEEVVEGA